MVIILIVSGAQQPTLTKVEVTLKITLRMELFLECPAISIEFKIRKLGRESAGFYIRS